jgi:hypothetical protein
MRLRLKWKHSNALQLSLGERPRLPFTARNFLTRPPTGRYFSPALPSDCFAIDFHGHAISLSEHILLSINNPSKLACFPL